MKKILMFAAIAALFSFMSCQKEDNPAKEEAKDIVFTATIDNSGTRTTVDAANAKVAWVAGDQVAISDNASHSATYQVSDIDAQGKATFTKVSGDVLTTAPFTATYGSAPSTSQTYSATAPALPMSATSETTSLKFAVTCGLLELTITQTGESIKSVKVSDNATTPNTYTLNCGSGVSIESGAKFYIAVPAGTYTTFQFTNGTDVVRGRAGLSIVVAANHIKPVSSNFAPKYTSGTTDADYGIKVGSTWWAPVNCGYDATHPCGLFYQWGRKYGQEYDASASSPAIELVEGQVSLEDGNNESNMNNYYYTNNKDISTWSSSTESTSDDWFTTYNPCPSGWRVSTKEEMTALKNGERSWGTSKKIDGSASGSYNGYLCGKLPCQIFLPATGYRDYKQGNVINYNSRGYYWSSLADSEQNQYANRLRFGSDNDFGIYGSRRANGFSVRCVKD